MEDSGGNAFLGILCSNINWTVAILKWILLLTSLFTLCLRILVINLVDILLETYILVLVKLHFKTWERFWSRICIRNHYCAKLPNASAVPLHDYSPISFLGDARSPKCSVLQYMLHIIWTSLTITFVGRSSWILSRSYWNCHPTLLF